MIYLIPGIGADHRVFETINIRGFETTILRWEHPYPNEPIEAYTKRLLPQVKHAAPVFIGLSFGGLIAAELTKHFPGSQLILISSIASVKELAWYSRLGAFLRMNKMFPGSFMKTPNGIIRWFFSIDPGHDRKLFDAILHDSDPDFLYWALNTLLHWKGNALHRLHHLHGADDRLIPVGNTSADIILPGAGHFMIVSHGPQISEILGNLLRKAGIAPN